MQIRTRNAHDLVACEAVARAVLAADGYPPRLPPLRLREFISGPQPLAAWVAVADDRVLGQVVLNSAASPEVLSLARRTTGLQSYDFGVVARLLVSPTARRRGAATALLDIATTEARTRGLQPLLDVATHFAGAIALYESSGWRRIGEVSVAISDQEPLAEYVYLAP